MTEAAIGTIVRARSREWVVLPPDDPGVIRLRPLAGSEAEVAGIARSLVDLGLETVAPSTFPLPSPDGAGDAGAVRLLFDAARLSLRDGAAPFRSLGRVSVRPRPYQFVPLLMALRLDPVRLLIADDVGVGKTVESLLIARELVDRGEIRRVCVICPPYLCDQWRRELEEKFHLPAVVIRSGTVGALERELPLSGEQSIYQYYPFIVVSIDYVKSDRNKAAFLLHCPSFVIVDEAHGAARPAGSSKGQQQRHALLKDLAAKPDRHLVLLTATPHSGVAASFSSLLGLLKPEFEELDLTAATEEQRAALARHFVQRRRADIVHWLGEETPFPDRVALESTYALSSAYNELFTEVYDFSRELVRTGETLTGWNRRIRYWTAIALLRCVMSSPAAASSALGNAAGLARADEEDETDEDFAPFVFEPTDEAVVDAAPSPIVEQGSAAIDDRGRRTLARFATLAKGLAGPKQDAKLATAIDIVRQLLDEGRSPIVWCRYIATAKYLAIELDRALGKQVKGLRVVAVTGEQPEEERREIVAGLGQTARRVLVATDCLSEGINLQEWFDAVLHYDLPWNPNRLEQREGRVDRFGQPAREVKAVQLYGRDNPVDMAVIDVLLKKAVEIRRTLGITVPVPAEAETVMNSVIRSLFFRPPKVRQTTLASFVEDPANEDGAAVIEVHRQWDEAAAREKASRTRFAQRGIKPEEVAAELAATDRVLGDPGAVRAFVLDAVQRLGGKVEAKSDGTACLSTLNHLPEPVRAALNDATELAAAFTAPAPAGSIVLGRNHSVVSALATALFESAMVAEATSPASRCGVIRTTAVPRLTVLQLLRIRCTVEAAGASPLLAEEVLVRAYRGHPPDADWLPDDEALALLAAAPTGNVTPEERRERIADALGEVDDLAPARDAAATEYAAVLQGAHRRVRGSAGLSKRVTVIPHLPPDLLGLVVLVPEVRR